MLGSKAGYSRVDWREIGCLLIMCGLLFYSASWQIFKENADAARYQCYAVAFWQGWPALSSLQTDQCTFLTQPSADLTAVTQPVLLQRMQELNVPDALIQFVAAQVPDQPGHTLPYEYPWLMLIFFSLGLLAPSLWYQVAFGVVMLLIAVGLYAILKRWRSPQAALAYLLYLVLGGWATLVGRFDMVPAALTLLTLLCADRGYWKWAYALLACAVFTKFYPLILLLPLFIAHQQTSRGRWYAWQRWLPLFVFGLVSLVIVVISFFLSVAGTLAPLSYLGYRPVQVESFAATVLWLASLPGLTTLSFEHTFGSLNVVSSWSSGVTLLTNGMLGVGLLTTWWLQWRKKIDLGRAMLLSLLIVIITGKVFSPQYLIWIIPLLAYTGQADRRWLLSWGVIMILTVWIYPHIYRLTNILNVPYHPLFFPVTVARNLLFLAWILYCLYISIRKPVQVENVLIEDQQPPVHVDTVGKKA